MFPERRYGVVPELALCLIVSAPDTTEGEITVEVGW